MEGASTYTIASVNLQYPISSNPLTRVDITLAADGKLPLLRKNPTVLYVKDDRISDLTNSTYSTILNSGNLLIQYRILKTVKYTAVLSDDGIPLFGPNGYVYMPGLYLVYNPTNHSDNIGYEVTMDGITQVDFETLQKYAPWRIYPAVT